MLIMDPDSVLGPKPDGSEPDANHLFLSREASRSSHANSAENRSAVQSNPAPEASAGEIRNCFRDQLGRIKSLRSKRDTDLAPAATLTLSMPASDLSSARGIMVGVALGIGTWALIAGLIGILYL